VFSEKQAKVCSSTRSLHFASSSWLLKNNRFVWVLAASDSGRFEGPEEERLQVLMLAARLGAPFVDIELKVRPPYFLRFGT
jgi:hypothetical protein